MNKIQKGLNIEAKKLMYFKNTCKTKIENKQIFIEIKQN